jgi:hypothetical protein
MTYFNFNYVTDPPNDEFVNVTTDLNDNLDEIDTKIRAFNQMPSNFTGITKPVGLEAFDESVLNPNRVSVWDGTTWRGSVSHTSTWTVWQTIPIRSPVVIRTGFPVMARVNAWRREVVLSGGVQADGVASAWTTASNVEITTDAAIGTSFLPANTAQMAIRYGATGQITTASGFASAVVIIEKKTSPDRTAISVRYQGDAGGGNFIMLDGVSWYY